MSKFILPQSMRVGSDLHTGTLKVGAGINVATDGTISTSTTEIGAVPSSDVVTSAAANKILKLNASSQLPASITGNAATTTKLATGRTIALTGDITGTSGAFDGSANLSFSTLLSNSGVTAGTYTKLTVDAKGRVTDGTSLVATDIPSLDWSKITTGKPTTLSGYGITDGATKLYIDGEDAKKINKAGDTMTGLLTLSGNPTANLHAATKQYVDGLVVDAGSGLTKSGTTISHSDTSSQVSVANSNGTVIQDVTLDTYGHITSLGSIDLDARYVKLSGSTLTGFLTLHDDPTNAYHAVTKQYVDNLAAGIDVRKSVRVATTANITLSGLQTIDGVVLAAGNRVLVKDQTVKSQNGIYVVASGAWTRSEDADGSPSSEVSSGMFTFVEEGTANADSGWILITDGAVTLGTTNLEFTQFTGAGQITPGVGLSKTGNTIDLLTATSSVLGGVKVTSGNGLSFSNGVISHTTGAGSNHIPSGGASGNFLKYSSSGVATWVTPDLLGLSDTTITSIASGNFLRYNGTKWVNTNLVSTDIPNLDWSKITTGKPTTLSGYGITDGVNSSEVVTTATANKILKLNASSKLPASITGDADGNAATTTKLATARTISLTGDVTGSVSFDGSANASISATIKNSGVSAGSYRTVTVNSQGIVTGGSNPNTAEDYGLTNVVTKTANSSDVALTTTVETSIANFTPTQTGNYIVFVYFRLASNVNINVNVTYTDGAGLQTQEIVSGMTDAGSYAVSPIYINATTGSPIEIKAASSVANQAHVSASIVRI